MEEKEDAPKKYVPVAVSWWRCAHTVARFDRGRLRIAIVGAGVCGVQAMKCCLEEGLEPVIQN